MSRRFSLTPAARLDLCEINDYLCSESERTARKIRIQIHQAMKLLAQYPLLGHVREDLADEPLRFWPVYSYLIIYRAEKRPIQIVRVLHGARDVKYLLSGA